MAEKSGGTIDRVTTDWPYNEARCTGARLYYPIKYYKKEENNNFQLYNTISFISNIEHNYNITKKFTQHWDGWKGGGQKNNLIVVHPQHLIFIVNVK